MSTAPPTRRSRFQFGLGTLFVMVTLFACWLGWTLYQVRKREELLRYFRTIPNEVAIYLPKDNTNLKPWRQLPRSWKWFGAKPV